MFDRIVASDRAEGATPGARWRMCHMRGSEILRVVEDMTLTRDGLATTPNDADRQRTARPSGVTIHCFSRHFSPIHALPAETWAGAWKPSDNRAGRA